MQPSAMADYSAVFENVNNMRIVPVDTKMIIIMAIVLVLPFLPLVLIEISVWEIIQKIGGTFF